MLSIPSHPNNELILRAVEETIRNYGASPALLGTKEFAECFFNGVMIFDILKQPEPEFFRRKKNRPEKPPIDYGARIAKLSRRLGLGYVVLDAAYRKDLKDGGASYVAHYLKQFRKSNPDAIVETVLSPGFRGVHLPIILKENPDVMSYSIPIHRLGKRELRRLRKTVMLARAMSRNKPIRVILSLDRKTRFADVLSAMRGFRKAGADMLVLRAAGDLKDEDNRLFELCEREAYHLGFRHVVSKPRLNPAYDLPEFISSIY